MAAAMSRNEGIEPWFSTGALSTVRPPSGRTAFPAPLAFARRQEISLLFTDVVLPKGLNGLQLAEEATRRRPGLKVL
jgi:hypothetical protein